MNPEDLIRRINALEHRLSDQERKETADMTTGWSSDSDTWVQVSLTSFKIIGKNVVARFEIGSKLKFINAIQKYAYVIAAAMSGSDTLVTIAGYGLAGLPISLPSYSYASTPQGFPGVFNYDTVWTAGGTAPALGNGTLTSQFSMNGKLITASIDFTAGTTTTFGTGLWYFTLPVMPTVYLVGGASLYNATVGTEYGGVSLRISGQNVYGLYQTSLLQNNAPFTWASGSVFVGSITYF